MGDGFGGCAGHDARQGFEDDQQIGRVGAGEGPDIGAPVPGQHHDTLRFQTLQRLAHGAAADAERIRDVGLDQLLGGDHPAGEDGGRDPVDHAVGEREAMVDVGAAAWRAGDRGVLWRRIAGNMVDNPGHGKEGCHGQA